MTAQKQAAQFMARWLRAHWPATGPRGQEPTSLWDARAREFHRRAWDALNRAHPELYRQVRAHAGVADTWALVEELWRTNRP